MTVSGSSEALVPGIADASLDVVETGTSAALNGLVIRESFERVTTHLVRSDECDQLAAVSVIKLLADARRLMR
jgi:ATP phosphoribosyltransferase